MEVSPRRNIVMKKKPLSYYLDIIKSALDKRDWRKAKHLGEITLKKINHLSYSPLDEFLFYYRLGNVYFYLSEYSYSLDNFYKAYLIASKHHLAPAYIAYASFAIGENFLLMKNINQALIQFQKIESSYQKYRNTDSPIDNETYVNSLMGLGFVYLHKNELEKVEEIIQKKLPQFQSFISDNKSILVGYNYLKGEYLIEQKEYTQARQSFEECVKISESLNLPYKTIEASIRLAVINLLDGQLESAIQILQFLLKDARKSKFNDLMCEVGLILSKCYVLKNTPDKAAIIEKRIKPILNKLDIVWLYEKTREFEQLYNRLQSIYKNTRYENKPVPTVLTNTLNQRHETSVDKGIIIIGQSSLIQEVYQLIEKIAPTDLPVLIQGETGVGKELIARTIHQNSLRREKNCLALNCAALSETLLESELFGYTKGSFTDAHQDKKGYIELASDGTLFLDEIAEMLPAMQQKLLRVLEEKLIWRIGAQKPIQVNPRFICATNQNIEQLVTKKLFREDLFYRINTFVITIPPLRERKEDIPLLVKHFLKKYTVTVRHSEHNRESLPFYFT